MTKRFDEFDELAARLWAAFSIFDEDEEQVSCIATALRSVAQEERRKALEEAEQVAKTHQGDLLRHAHYTAAHIAGGVATSIRALLDQPTPGKTKE